MEECYPSGEAKGPAMAPANCKAMAIRTQPGNVHTAPIFCFFHYNVNMLGNRERTVPRKVGHLLK